MTTWETEVMMIMGVFIALNIIGIWLVARQQINKKGKK
jgi:hypothetical protein